jgi:hypothetical protein
MLVMNSKGLDKLLAGEFILGAEGSIAAGPVGRTASAKAQRVSGLSLCDCFSPFLETLSCFLQGDNRGLATSHRHPPHRISGGRTTLTVTDGTIHASLPQTHVARRRYASLVDVRYAQ